MVLQYAVWGIWMPILARYLQAPVEQGGLGFTQGQVGWILGLAASIGAVTAPFIAGQFADRHFSAERFMAVLLLVGGLIKYVTAFQTTFTAWVILSVLYSIVYMPTLSLTNSVAFAHLDDADAEWPLVRVFGSFGWIAASWLFPMLWLQTDLHFQWLPPFFIGNEVADSTHRLADSLKAAGVISVGYAIFCLGLPRTPPKKEAVEPLAFAKAFALLKHPSFAWLVIASLPISIIHQIYFMQTAPFFSDVLGLQNSYIGPAMTIGQFAELFVMASLGYLLKGAGFRFTITLGCLAYVLRYAIFGAAATIPNEFVIASQALHGFCYACFFASAYIYVERIADADVRNSAQTVFGIIILGIGPVIAAPTLGALSQAYSHPDEVRVQLTDGEIIQATLNEESGNQLTVTPVRVVEPARTPGGVSESVEVGTQVTLNKTDDVREMKEYLDYRALWNTLAIIALVTMFVFWFMFRDETRGVEAPIAPEELHQEVLEA